MYRRPTALLRDSGVDLRLHPWAPHALASAIVHGCADYDAALLDALRSEGVDTAALGPRLVDETPPHAEPSQRQQGVPSQPVAAGYLPTHRGDSKDPVSAQPPTVPLPEPISTLVSNMAFVAEGRGGSRRETEPDQPQSGKASFTAQALFPLTLAEIDAFPAPQVHLTLVPTPAFATTSVPPVLFIGLINIAIAAATLRTQDDRMHCTATDEGTWVFYCESFTHAMELAAVLMDEHRVLTAALLRAAAVVEEPKVKEPGPKSKAKSQPAEDKATTPTVRFLRSLLPLRQLRAGAKHTLALWDIALPSSAIRETAMSVSPPRCVGKSPNKHNRVFAQCTSLGRDVAAAFEERTPRTAGCTADSMPALTTSEGRHEAAVIHMAKNKAIVEAVCDDVSAPLEEVVGSAVLTASFADPTRPTALVVQDREKGVEEVAVWAIGPMFWGDLKCRVMTPAVGESADDGQHNRPAENYQYTIAPSVEVGRPASILVEALHGTVLDPELHRAITIGFQVVCARGPLTESPTCGVRMSLTDVMYPADPRRRGMSQVAPAARRAMTAALMAAGPAVMVPEFHVRFAVCLSRRATKQLNNAARSPPSSCSAAPTSSRLGQAQGDSDQRLMEVMRLQEAVGGLHDQLRAAGVRVMVDGDGAEVDVNSSDASTILSQISTRPCLFFSECPKECSGASPRFGVAPSTELVSVAVIDCIMLGHHAEACAALVVPHDSSLAHDLRFPTTGVGACSSDPSRGNDPLVTTTHVVRDAFARWVPLSGDVTDPATEAGRFVARVRRRREIPGPFPPEVDKV